MAEPILVDAFCGAGGAGEGYRRAGFYVIGVDSRPQPRYSGDEFVQGDALEFLEAILANDGYLPDGRRVAAIHASPPCQLHSAITAVSGGEHPELVAPTRELLLAIDVPYVIENVPRAPLINPVVICGAVFCPTIEEDGGRFYLNRHRLFECSFALMVPPCACSRDRGTVLGIYGGGTRQDTRKEANPGGGNTSKANKKQAAALMGIDWMTRTEMCQAIPPAYTEHIGEYLLAEVSARV